MSSTAQIGVTLYGQGPEGVLVMHDWNGDHTIYDPVLAYLDGDRFTYAFVDLRGYGKSREILGTYSVAEIARDCIAVADRLGFDRFHVMGHSMTGMAVQRIAADVPARIKSAVVVCAMSAAGSPAPHEALQFFASTTTNDEAFCRLIKYVTGLGDGWAKAKLRQCRQSVNPACRDGYLAMFSQTNFVAEIQGLGTPFLVIVGDQDPGLDELAMKETFLTFHPHAEVVTIRGCGHYPMQEAPPRFAMIVETYLRAHG